MKLKCPSCGAGLKVDDTSAGKKAKCPKCRGLVIIPDAKRCQVVFPIHTKLTFPTVCVDCLCSNPPEVLSLDCGIEEFVVVGMEQGVGDKIGTVMGQGFLGGILGGIVGATVGSMFDKQKVKRERRAVPVPVPICQRCRAALPQEFTGLSEWRQTNETFVYLAPQFTSQV